MAVNVADTVISSYRRRQDNIIRLTNCYFVQRQDTQLIKIGCSQDYKKRIRQLSSIEKTTLTILGIQGGTRKFETGLHERFKSLNVKGEWFRPAPELLQYIEENCQSVADATYTPTLKARRYNAGRRKRQILRRLSLPNTHTRKLAVYDLAKYFPDEAEVYLSKIASEDRSEIVRKAARETLAALAFAPVIQLPLPLAA